MGPAVQRFRIVVPTLLLAAVLSLLPTGSARAEDDPRAAWPADVRGWFDDLASEDAAKRATAVEMLGTAAGAPTLALLQRGLFEAKPAETVDAAAAVLAMHGKRGGFVRLIRRLDARDGSVLGWLRRATHQTTEPLDDDDIQIVDAGAFVPGAEPPPEPSKAAVSPPDDSKGRWWKWLAQRSDEELAHLRSGSWTLWLATTTPDWLDFHQAVWILQEEGDRAAASRLFAAMAARHPESANAERARELAGVLAKMVEEDRAWKEKPSTDPVARRVHELREVANRQMSQPGRVGVLGFRGSEDNPANGLVACGEAAVPALAALLDDRRATRTVGFWRSFHPHRTILRYQDAAAEILGEILPFRIYVPSGTASYFSEEPPERWAKARETVKRWLEESAGKDPVEKRLLAAAHSGMWDALKILGELGVEPSARERVLARLRELYSDPKRRAWRPDICEKLCELGDRSKLSEVLAGTKAEAPLPTCDDFLHPDPDDGARFLNAHETIQRLKAKYGTPEPEPPATPPTPTPTPR